jgi:NAD-dependent dihydropyrimidine dehydrogenase PreA subunit
MSFKLRKEISSHTTLAYRTLPLSGNVINGLKETEWRQARHVFHNDGDDVLAWDQLDNIFDYVNPWQVATWIMRNVWYLRKSTGPTASSRRRVDDQAAMTREIKQRAQALGAGLVGVARVKPEHIYQGHQVPYQNAIAIGVVMDREKMKRVPDVISAEEVMRAYARIGKITSQLSEEIRAMGWPARAYGNPNSGDLLHIPIALDCGFGQLGKHGSLISKEYGSNFRLGTVVTDLPLVSDDPADIGVDDLCTRCNVCVRDCPVDAIYNDKQVVRGVNKWYVDFDKCVYYFTETAGCGICIEVCPWSEEQKGPWLSEKLLAKRRGDAARATRDGSARGGEDDGRQESGRGPGRTAASGLSDGRDAERP